MSDHSDLLTLPQPVPTVTVGGTRTGSEVIDCRIVRPGDAGRTAPAPVAGPVAGPVLSGPVRGADGVWEITVPDHPTPLTDLVDPAEEPRILDDGWLAAGALLARRLSELVAVHPVRAKRHLVQVAVPADAARRSLRGLVTGLCIGGHVPDVAGARRTGRHPVLQAVHIDISATTLGEGEVRKAVRTGTVLGAATACARDLGAVPASAATPAWWRRTAKAVLGDLPGTRAKLHGAGWLQRKGFTGLLSAAAGEAADRETSLGEGEAALLELVWDPDAAGGELTDARPDTVLVGGATVPAAVRALAELGASRKVVGLVPVTGPSTAAVEVRPGRPDEFVRHINGLVTRVNVRGNPARRAEVTQRLPLADTVAWAVHRYRPTQVITVGPLSAATRVALGDRTGAVVTGDRDLARRLALRGAKVGERWWPLPAPDHLDAAVTAPDADLLLVPPGPEVVTGALYLRRFAAGTGFIHLDTTGPALSCRTAGECDEGITGFGARTLVEWLRN